MTFFLGGVGNFLVGRLEIFLAGVGNYLGGGVDIFSGGGCDFLGGVDIFSGRVEIFFGEGGGVTKY